MAEGSPGSGRIIPEGLRTDQHWCNNAACQSQHTADCRCVLRGGKTSQVSIRGLFLSTNRLQIGIKINKLRPIFNLQICKLQIAVTVLIFKI